MKKSELRVFWETPCRQYNQNKLSTPFTPDLFNLLYSVSEYRLFVVSVPSSGLESLWSWDRFCRHSIVMGEDVFLIPLSDPT